MQTTSKILSNPLKKWLNKTGISKKELAKDLRVSQQTPTDWTGSKPKPVTADNGVRLAEISNDSDFIQDILWIFYGVFKRPDGIYKSNLNSVDNIRQVEEDERDVQREKIRRLLSKEEDELSKEDCQQILQLVKEQSEAVIYNIEYLSSLCEVLRMSIKDAYQTFMPAWQEAGYFGGEK